MKKLLLLLALPLAAQTTINPKSLAFTADGLAATQAFMVTQVNSLVGVTLNGALDAVTTTVTVSDASNIPQSSELWIDGEAMAITNKTGKVYTVTRGDLGTTAKVHANGVAVDTLQYPTLNAFAATCVINTVQDILGKVVAGSLPCPNCSVALQGTAVQTAKAAQAAQKNGAVQ